MVTIREPEKDSQDQRQTRVWGEKTEEAKAQSPGFIALQPWWRTALPQSETLSSLQGPREGDHSGDRSGTLPHSSGWEL